MLMSSDLLAVGGNNFAKKESAAGKESGSDASELTYYRGKSFGGIDDASALKEESPISVEVEMGKGMLPPHLLN